MALQNIAVELDDTIYQMALSRAEQEGRTLPAALADLLSKYAHDAPPQILTSYVVKAGDSLSRIAREVYGDPHKYPLIQKANNLSDPGRIWVGQVLVVPTEREAAAPAAPVAPTPAAPVAPAPAAPQPAAPPPPPKMHPCTAIAGQNYGTLPVVGPPTDRPADKHGDINLELRGFTSTDAVKGLIDMAGPTDHRAPQLAGLFSDNRTPTISGVYQAHNWDWGSNSRAGVVIGFDVTVAGMAVEPGETIHVPDADYEIGQGYAVLVLYASTKRITLKYTGEDSVVNGYTIHVDGICVEPGLLALYKRMNSEGRGHLPALRAGQPFGRARDTEIQVAIRDTGRFMDPRVRKDWWQGR
jgi:LysM repeat protein